MNRLGLLTTSVFASFFLIIGCGVASAPKSSVSTSQNQNAQAPSLQLSASPLTISQGAFATLQWSTSNATNISFSPPIEQEDTSLPLTGSFEVAPQQTVTYTATATGAGGRTQKLVTISVNAALPSLTLVAAPSAINSGATAILSWSSQNATDISIDGIGPVAVPSGSVSVTPAVTTTYTAQAIGPGGSTTASAKVTVSSVSFTPSTSAISPGQSVVLRWNAPTATSASIDQGIGPVVVPSGQLAVTPSSTTRYTITATDAAGNSSSATALVVVSSAGANFLNLKHIMFFIQENRSFDNYFGQMGEYRASRGFTDSFDGLPPNTALLDAAGELVPSFHFQTVCHQNTPPSWFYSWNDYDSGKMDGFVVQASAATSSIDPKGTRAMGFYDWTDLPYYYDLAFQFATSDRFFSPVMASTIPNRMYLFAATSFGNVYAPTTNVTAGWTQPTIFDMLDQAGISWRYYYQDNSVFLTQWSTWLRDSGKVWNISHFYTDINNEATLPQVIFIERATQLGLDEHPGGEDVQLGAANSEKIIGALLQSAAWPSSALIYSYDEAGGLYDHVPPVQVPAPDDIPPATQSGGDFKHTGFRIPVTVISPWVKPHFVSHVPRDLTSILKLIEVRFGVKSLTARDAAADDMTEFFDFSSPALLTPPALASQPINGTCDENLEKAPNF